MKVPNRSAKTSCPPSFPTFHKPAQGSEKRILVRNAAREVGQGCPLVLKLSGLVLHTSWAGSESLSEKVSLWVEKFRFFAFAGILYFDRPGKRSFE